MTPLSLLTRRSLLWEDKVVVLSLLQSTGRTLQFASDQIKEDKDMFCVAAKTTTTVFEDCVCKDDAGWRHYDGSRKGGMGVASLHT